MFINIDSDYLFSDLYKRAEKNEVLSPQEGLIIGNLFYDMYEPYKNYKPKELKAHSEKGKLMLKIQELSLAVNDLGLYLNIHPEDKKMYHLFKQYVLELKRNEAIYSEKYEALDLESDLGESYTWYKSPWPWEVNDV